jgi:hypothetical protein
VGTWSILYPLEFFKLYISIFDRNKLVREKTSFATPFRPLEKTEMMSLYTMGETNIHAKCISLEELRQRLKMMNGMQTEYISTHTHTHSFTHTHTHTHTISRLFQFSNKLFKEIHFENIPGELAILSGKHCYNNNKDNTPR